ncbi:MAG TPA: amidohydrolase family protein, partial [Vicinamibacterales bacterium]
RGLRVVAHVYYLADAKELLRAGIDGFVHTVRDRDVDDEYVALVKAHPKVWTGPNVPSPGETEDEIASLAETLPASTIGGLRTQLAQRVAAGNPANALFDLHCRNLKRIHDADMTIGAGTDGTGDGFGAHEQMAAYTQCGMTTMEALVAATSINARILKLDRLGTVAARKEASLVVLDANPLDDILNTRRIGSVYLRGEEVDRKKLRAGFQQAPSSK